MSLVLLCCGLISLTEVENPTMKFLRETIFAYILKDMSR